MKLEQSESWKNLKQFDLANKSFVVSGSNGFLGANLCEYLLEENARVFGIDLTQDQPILNEGIIRLKADLTSKKSICIAAEVISSKVDKIDGIINFSAINPTINNLGHVTNLEGFNFEEHMDSIRLSYLGNLNLITALLPLLKKADRSSIVLLGSDLSFISPDQRLYCTCSPSDALHSQSCSLKPPNYSFEKSGIIGLTKYLATLLAEWRIRVNCLCPGPVVRDFPADFTSKLLERTPLNKLGNPSDVNSGAHYLLSDGSSHVTGTSLLIDGGRTAW
jgi:NAD(P)-dependent dehydrogenase (short-subunit alcohol dehydrogenase family)